MKSRQVKRRADRVVRRVMADGTTKEYRYAAFDRKARNRPDGDSITALLEAYQRSPEWRRLKTSTQQTYGIYLREMNRVGHVPVSDVTRRDILLIRDAIAGRRGNGAATGFIRATSALFGWAVDRQWIDHSPVHRIKALPGGHLLAWTAGDVQTALDRLPEHLRRVVVLALYTGQRRGDLCALPWSAYDGRTIRLVQQKTGEALVIPCHPALKVELDAWRQDQVTGVAGATILTDRRGKPWKPNLLSHYLPAELVKAGLSNELNVHGLRKFVASMLAEASCSTHEIAAITGHRTLAMVQLYTRSADQERLAGAAIIRLSERPYNAKKA